MAPTGELRRAARDAASSENRSRSSRLALTSPAGRRSTRALALRLFVSVDSAESSIDRWWRAPHASLGSATTDTSLVRPRARTVNRLELDAQRVRMIQCTRVTSLLVHAALGAATIAFFFVANAHLYRRDWPGSRTSALEAIYYATAIVSVCIGWYFNQKYVFMYPEA